MRKHLALLSLCAAATTACESPISPDELLRLADAKAQWDARPFSDYSFEVRQSCSCPFEWTQWARVEVVAGQITRVVLIATGSDLPPPQRDYFPTVERIFEMIGATRSDDWVEDISVAYDPQLGYPTLVAFRPKPNILDAGGAFYLRNAGPMPVPPPVRAP